MKNTSSSLVAEICTVSLFKENFQENLPVINLDSGKISTSRVQG